MDTVGLVGGRRGRVSVSADLRFEAVTADGRLLHGHLTGIDSDLTLRVDDASAFASPQDARGVREVAEELARRGVRVHVEDGSGGRLLSLGAVRSPWWQRPFTRSRYLRVAAVRGVLTAVRGRASRTESLLPQGGLGLPPTLFPLAPTFARRPVRRVTTTHDPHRGGAARLVEMPADGIWRTENPTHWLQEVTTIGSDPSCDVVLPGLAPRHAEVRHDADDEYVLVALDPRTRVHGRPVREQILRTSARVELAEGVLVTFVREEFADHGRAYGGRIGGELGHQVAQPPRPGGQGPAPRGDDDPAAGADW